LQELQEDQGYKKTEIGTIPSDWEVVKLDEISNNFIGGGTPSTSNPNYWNGNIAWMRSAWIHGRYVVEGEKHITNLGLDNSATNIVPKNSLLIATRVSMGNVAINKIDIAISQDLTGIVDRSKANEEYVYWTLLKSKNRIRSYSQGTTIQGLTREDLKNLKIPFPPILEQQKIASIISKVDELIQKTDQVIEQTQRLKKGLMQRLLTKGIGHTKFKESRLGFRSLKIEIPESWELLKLKQVSINGLQNGIFKRRDEFGKGAPIVNVSDLFSDSDIAVDKLERVTVNGSELRQFSIQEGDIFFCRSSLVSDGIGRSNIITYLDEPAVFECHVMMSRPDKKKVIPKFLAYYTQSETAKKFLLSVSMTLTMTTIRQPDLESLPVPIPPLHEQEKITLMLTSVDSKIQKQQACKSNLEKLKIGLMQKLLTGQIRVKV
jgi:type I restriction enzyme S subunit